MIDYDLWRQRLKSEMGSQLKHYGLASDIKTVLKNAVKTTPALFVIPKDENNKSQNSTGTYRDIVTGGIDVLIIVSDYSDALGAKAGQSLKAIRDGIHTSLRGWTPPDCADVVNYRGGKRVSMAKGLLLWADTYESLYQKG